MRRVLVFGASGQVGTALGLTVPPDVTLLPYTSKSADLRDPAQIASAIREQQPDIVINCAAFTRVDDAESMPEEAMLVNGTAPGVMARHCSEVGARLLHISTDYVFSGTGPAPYGPTAATSPLSVYGATKLEGERQVLEAQRSAAIVRTAWVHSGGGQNFVATAARLLSAGKSMRVVDDQVGTPTRAQHLAEALWQLAVKPDVRGILHFTDAGVASWYDVANVVRDTLRAHGRLPEGVVVTPVGTEAFPRPAARPACAVLDKRATWTLLGVSPVDWREGIITSTIEILHA